MIADIIVGAELKEKQNCLGSKNSAHIQNRSK